MPRSAAACSWLPELVEACTAVRLYRPASSFPVDLENELRIALFARDEYGGHTSIPFDSELSLLVHRRVGAGYDPVAFQLVEQPGLATGVRHLELTDPQPGEYVVSTNDPHCGDDEPSPAGEGTVVGHFELEASAPVPTSLGSLRWLGQQSYEEERHLGTDSECNTVRATVVGVRSVVELSLSPEAHPWGAAIDVSVHVDGELEVGFSALPESVDADGTHRVTFNHVCSSSEPGPLNQNRLTEGVHTAMLRAQISDLGSFDSSAVSFSLDCDAPGDALSTDPVPSAGGCSASGATSNGGSFLLALLLLMRARRAERLVENRDGSGVEKM